MFDLKSKARDVSERGYCVLESVYDNRECEQMRTIFKQLCDDKNGFSSEQPLNQFSPALGVGTEDGTFLRKAGCRRRYGRGLSRTTCALHTAVPLSLTTRSLKKPSPVGTSTTHGEIPSTGLPTGESRAGALQYLRGRI